jgi:hypothetical protein
MTFAAIVAGRAASGNNESVEKVLLKVFPFPWGADF